MGVKVPKAINAYFDPSPMPNQITNSGSSAIFGIGKIAATSGTSPARTRLKSPIIVPTAIPRLTPMSEPMISRVSDGAMWSNKRPVL